MFRLSYSITNGCSCKGRFIPHPILSEGVFSQVIDKETPVDAIPTEKNKNMIAEIDDYLHESGVSLSVRANVFNIADRYSEGGKKV